MNCEPLQTDIYNNQKVAIDSSSDNRLEEWEYGRKLHDDDYKLDACGSGTISGTSPSTSTQAERRLRRIVYKVKLDNLKRVSKDKSSWSVEFMPNRVMKPPYSSESSQPKVEKTSSISRRLTKEALAKLCQDPYKMKNRYFEGWASKSENLELFGPLTDYEKRHVYTENCDSFWYDFADKDFADKVKPDLEPFLYDYFQREINDLVKERNEKNLHDIGSLSNLSVEVKIDPWKFSKTPKGKYYPGLTKYYKSTLDDDCMTVQIISKVGLFDHIDQPKRQPLFKFIDFTDEKYYKPDFGIP